MLHQGSFTVNIDFDQEYDQVNKLISKVTVPDRIISISYNRTMNLIGKKDQTYIVTQTHRNISYISISGLSVNQQAILNVARQIVTQHGVNVDDAFVIEFARDILSDQPSNPLVWHHDIYSFGPSEISVILYFGQNEAMTGGRLLIDLKQQDHVQINPVSGTYVMIDSNVLHTVEPMSGSGIRRAIIVHFSRN